MPENLSSYEFYEIFKNTSSTEQLQAAASGADLPRCNFRSLFLVSFMFQNCLF